MVAPKTISTLLGMAIPCVAFVLSFRAYALFLSPEFNSDHAIHVLMTDDLVLPEDLYYWGQDRLGSLAPILGHLLLKIMPVSSAVSVSYVQYFLLLIGYLCFASLLTRSLSRLILAIAWFLPPAHLSDLLRVGQPYAGQFALTGIAIALLNQLLKAQNRFSKIKTQLIITLSTLSLWLAVWVSDFTIVLMIVLVGVLLREACFPPFQPSNRSILRLRNAFLNLSVANVLVTSWVGVLFIQYAKSTALRSLDQFKVSSPSQLAESLKTLGISTLETLTFQGISVFYTISWFVVLGVLLYLLINGNRLRVEACSKWFNLFLISAILGSVLVIASNWFYINDFNLRYFIPVYIYGWMALLLRVERTQLKTALGLLLTGAVVSFSLTLPYVYSLQQPVAQLERLKPISALSPAGIIGNYWSSYVLCSVDPAQLSCTIPDLRQGEFACPAQSLSENLKRAKSGRCPRCTRRVFEAQTIYVVKEGWLDALPQPIDFPPMTQQFGQCLVKVGEPLKLAGYTLAPYKRQPLSKPRSPQTVDSAQHFFETSPKTVLKGA